MLQTGFGTFAGTEFMIEFSQLLTLGVSLTFGALIFCFPLSLSPFPLEDLDQFDNEDELLSDPEIGDKDRFLALIEDDRLPTFLLWIVIFTSRGVFTLGT